MRFLGNKLPMEQSSVDVRANGRIDIPVWQDLRNMDILDRLLGHDTWTTRQLLLRCRELTDAQMDTSFDIGDRNLRDTFQHIIGCMESHTYLIRERATSSYPDDSGTIDALLARLTTVGQDFAEFAAKVQREGTTREDCDGGVGNMTLEKE